MSLSRTSEFRKPHLQEDAVLSLQTLTSVCRAKLSLRIITLQRLPTPFNVNFEWLRNGIGEMFTEEKTIGKAQFAAFSQVLDANTSPVSQNIISGDNYQGTQTINATDGKITVLEQKIDALTQLLAEKDKLVAEQSNVIAEQRKQIQMRNETN